MDARLQDTLNNIDVLEPVTADVLQIFGLRCRNGDGLTYTTMDDALQAESLEVTEISEGGSVPELKVTNKGDSMVLLVAGEELIGAKQNRVLNASYMVGGKSEVSIPVSCVEAGRWGYQSRRFRGSGSSSHGYLRRKMSRDAYDGYRETGRPSSRQHEVWDVVQYKLDSMKSRSPSSALRQVYEDYEQRLNRVLEQSRVSKECCGVVFAFGGRIAGLDLFDRPETLTKLLPKLVKAYAIDALEEVQVREDSVEQPEQPQPSRKRFWNLFRRGDSGRPGNSPDAPVDRQAVADWLQTASRCESETYESPGLGQDVRVEGSDLVGACLVVEGQPVHVELFPEDEQEDRART